MRLLGLLVLTTILACSGCSAEKPKADAAAVDTATLSVRDYELPTKTYKRAVIVKDWFQIGQTADPGGLHGEWRQISTLEAVHGANNYESRWYWKGEEISEAEWHSRSTSGRSLRPGQRPKPELKSSTMLVGGNVLSYQMTTDGKMHGEARGTTLKDLVANNFAPFESLWYWYGEKVSEPEFRERSDRW